MLKMGNPDAGDIAPAKKRKSQRVIFLPNSSPTPNWFFDTVLSDSAVPHAARSVFLYLLRKTVGWDNKHEELSLTEIQYGAAVTRPTAIHAVRVICDCWGLFKKSRGRKGQHSSVFTIGGLTEAEFTERYELVSDIYGTGFPTAKQLRENPCTFEMLRAQRARVETECQQAMQSQK
jgi:hypothetical protein